MIEKHVRNIISYSMYLYGKDNNLTFCLTRMDSCFYCSLRTFTDGFLIFCSMMCSRCRDLCLVKKKPR